MNRLVVRCLLALYVTVSSLPTFAEDANQPRCIGVLLGGFSPDSKEAQQFRQGLLDAGYSEGGDVVIDWRSAGGNYARVPELVADLVQREVDVMVVVGGKTTLRRHGLSEADIPGNDLQPASALPQSCASVSTHRIEAKFAID